MQNDQAIARIREGGIAQGPKHADERSRQLHETCGFRSVSEARYALVASCFNPYLESTDMTAFRHLLDYFHVDYSLLPREYCCGDPFYLHAIDEKHKGDLDVADELAREFLQQNMKQAQELGADKLLVYCAGCDLVFNRLADYLSLEVIWHPTLLAALFKGAKLEMKADYYAGCHKYRQALLGNTPDLDSVLTALGKMEGLELHNLDSTLCCMNPDQLERLTSSIRNEVIITPCSGCSLFLRKALSEKGSYRVFLISEVMWAAINGHQL